MYSVVTCAECVSVAQGGQSGNSGCGTRSVFVVGQEASPPYENHTYLIVYTFNYVRYVCCIKLQKKNNMATAGDKRTFLNWIPAHAQFLRGTG